MKLLKIIVLKMCLFVRNRSLETKVNKKIFALKNNLSRRQSQQILNVHIKLCRFGGRNASFMSTQSPVIIIVDS
jgi:hypothetical protein